MKLEWYIWAFHFSIIIQFFYYGTLLNESTQKHSQKLTEEDTGTFLSPDTVISRSILILSRVLGHQSSWRPTLREWGSHQPYSWGPEANSQDCTPRWGRGKHFREDGATYLPGISFLGASLSNSYFSQKSVIRVQYWKRTGKLFNQQIQTGCTGRCWGRSRKPESKFGFTQGIKAHASDDSVSGEDGLGWGAFD